MNNYLYGVIAILVGVVLLFVGLYLGEAAMTTAPGANAAVAAAVEHLSLSYAFLLALQGIGVTLIGFGLLTLFLEIPDWRNYFADRVKEIVIQQDYLKSLDSRTLDALQDNVLKARFNDPGIDREGSFLSYFHQTLHRYIADPYREDVTAELLCEEVNDSGIKIIEKVTYACRKAGAAIQRNILWSADPDEFLAVDKVKASVQYPYTHKKRGEVVQLFEKTNLDVRGLEKSEIEQSLESYKEVDGLIVILESHYTVSVQRFQYWQMAHPTRNFQIMVTFPREYKIQMKPLVLNENLCLITNVEGYSSIKYDSWMLPMSGIAWRLIKEVDVAPATVPEAPAPAAADSAASIPIAVAGEAKVGIPS
jgi:hypothetical protein